MPPPLPLSLPPPPHATSTAQAISDEENRSTRRRDDTIEERADMEGCVQELSKAYRCASLVPELDCRDKPVLVRVLLHRTAINSTSNRFADVVRFRLKSTKDIP
jgi:hypothetical protein